MSVAAPAGPSLSSPTSGVVSSSLTFVMPSSLYRACYGDHLNLRHGLQRQAAAEPADAAARARTASEWQMDLPVGGGVVDVDDARRNGLGEAQSAVHVACEHSDGKAIFAVE